MKSRMMRSPSENKLVLINADVLELKSRLLHQHLLYKMLYIYCRTCWTNLVNYAKDISRTGGVPRGIMLSREKFEKFLHTIGGAGNIASGGSATALSDSHANTTGISINSVFQYDRDYWILYTGATNHMTNINY